MNRLPSRRKNKNQTEKGQGFSCPDSLRKKTMIVTNRFSNKHQVDYTQSDVVNAYKLAAISAARKGTLADRANRVAADEYDTLLNRIRLEKLRCS